MLESSWNGDLKVLLEWRPASAVGIATCKCCWNGYLQVLFGCGRLLEWCSCSALGVLSKRCSESAFGVLLEHFFWSALGMVLLECSWMVLLELEWCCERVLLEGCSDRVFRKGVLVRFLEGCS